MPNRNDILKGPMKANVVKMRQIYPEKTALHSRTSAYGLIIWYVMQNESRRAKPR